MDKQCIICHNSFETKRNGTKTCSPHYASILAGQNQRERRLQEWLSTGMLPYEKNTMIKVKSVYREYIEQEQNHRCAICGIENIWNGKPIVFVLDHIDGNSLNKNLDNLQILTRKENLAKRKGFKVNVRIYCIELNKEYDSMTSAIKELGATQWYIYQTLKGNNPKKAKYHFRYVGE